MKPHTISNDAQLNSAGRLVHLLGLEGLPKNQIEKILSVADDLLDQKFKLQKSKILRDMSVANLFFEPSTRTRNTFEIPPKRTSAKTINLDLATSLTTKNDTYMNTTQTPSLIHI